MNKPTTKSIEMAKYLFQILSNSNNADIFCKSVVHYLHTSSGITACSLARLDKEAKIRWIGRYGYETDTANVSVVSLWDKSASADAILNDSIAIVKNPNEYESAYEHKSIEHPNCIGLLVMPLKYQGQPIGSLGLGFDKEIRDSIFTPENIEILALGASTFLMGLELRPDKTSGIAGPADDARVTSRDIQILRLIDEGLTHYEIGRVMNLSESTIKQTSSLLYKKLGVGKKLEAVDQAKKLQLI